MLLQILVMVLEALFGFFTMALLARFLMQWSRAPFRNPIGKFVIAVTDGLVRPLRRVIPNPFRFDVSTLLLAWLTQVAYLGIALGVAGVIHAVSPTAVGALGLMAALELLRFVLYLIIGAVIVAAVLSWVNPYSPVAPVVDALAHPFLAPVRRHMPLIGGVDLSPLVVLLVLQVLLTLLGGARTALLPLFASAV